MSSDQSSTGRISRILPIANHITHQVEVHTNRLRDILLDLLDTDLIRVHSEIPVTPVTRLPLALRPLHVVATYPGSEWDRLANTKKETIQIAGHAPPMSVLALGMLVICQRVHQLMLLSGSTGLTVLRPFQDTITMLGNKLNDNDNNNLHKILILQQWFLK